jgi:midasin
MWIDMKSSVKARELDDSQYYKFRSRIIDIQDIFKGDVPSLSDMDSDAGPDNEEKLELEFFKIMVFPYVPYSLRMLMFQFIL